jgi:hypothetical protein
LRKTFIAAAAASLALGTAGIAYAQATPSISGTASVSPSKAGTSKSPKSTKLTLSVKNDPASKTTAKQIVISLPSTLKLSTKGLTQCTSSDDDILAGKCKSSKAGSGTANAVIVSTGAAVAFDVTPYVGKNELLFQLDGKGGISNKYVLHGKISGKKLTITIPNNVQQPVTGLYSALVDLKTTLSAKKGKSALITSTGCKSKAHKLGVTVAYAPNPTAPAQPSASTNVSAKCS